MRYSTPHRLDPARSRYAIKPHLFRTYNSKEQFDLVYHAWCRLEQSGIYWASISGKEAGAKLASEPIGTFLIRDSAARQHFFTLTIKTSLGIRNVRVDCDNRSFFLETEPTSRPIAPRFDCVLKLVHYYMTWKEHSKDQRPLFIYSELQKIPLEMIKPLVRSTSSLQHLCRKTVNGHLDVFAKWDWPLALKDFMKEYDAPI